MTIIGLSTPPDGTTPYSEGMHTIVIIYSVLFQMLAWIATLIAMRGYKLTGARMKEIRRSMQCEGCDQQRNERRKRNAEMADDRSGAG